MAGNVQGDNSGNIYVEFDYNNIILVDPNKTIDNLNNVRERLVDHENLVMFANLEAEVVPRTKLSVGGSPQDRARVLSVAKMNFLRPTEESFLTTGYLDEITGKDTKNGLGTNQMQEEIINPNNGTNAYSKMSITDPGEKATDNGLLGITNINVKITPAFIPSVTMTLEDVQGRALFQLGNNSPYSAFFNLPYCPFYLTLKGYYGKAIRYQLNLLKFNAKFNTYSGNYQIDLEFVGYKFNILNEISMGSLLAAPHMYSTTFNVSKSITSPEGGSNKNIESQSKGSGISQESTISPDNLVTELVAEKGYQKILEVYSEYKAKGLISPDFPELTLAQLMSKLQSFEQAIANTYPKVNVEPLTNIRSYKETLGFYFETIYGGNKSWFNTYMNPKPIILQGSGQEVYVFKQEFIDNPTKKEEAKSFLSAYTIDYNALLASNPTLGTFGSTPIKNSITYDTMIKQVSFTEIDLFRTTISQTGIVSPTESDTQVIKRNLEKIFTPNSEKDTADTRVENTFGNIIIPSAFTFETFQNLLSNMETDANQKLSAYETALSADLAKKLENSASGLGFIPTVRNMCAVIMASAEGFIRLLDEVHTKAWNVRYDPVRQLAILDNQSSAPGTDTLDYVKISENAQNDNQGLVNGQIPVYPWPQFFVETPKDKEGRFQLKYIADPSVVGITQGWNYSKWPEVEFVEEYLKGLTQKFNPPTVQPPIDSQKTTNIINFNAIEYPSEGVAYANKEEVKFFYEIWERQFLTSNYSGFIRGNASQIDQLSNLIVSAETNNIVTSLGVSSPFLTLKLKNYDITAQNYPAFLENISNQGIGRTYQDYIRDFYVTPYIKNITENSFNILSLTDLGKEPQTSAKSDGLLQLVKNAPNDPIIIDTYPFTDPTWVSNNMSNSSNNAKNSVYNTSNVLTVFEDRNVIANFNSIYDYTKNRPVTNFSYLKVSNPSNQITNSFELNTFYQTRKDPTFFVPTEGYVNYLSPNKISSTETTTSMLNTPYFINAIQNGVNNWRRNDPYPYAQAAYLFINSLPLASLKEKYKTDGASSDLDYIATCFKKFGAIHKMPYAWVLKMGSIWYRYKTYKNTNVDILDSVWKDFDYKTNFDPILSSDTKTYTFKFDGLQPNQITLQSASNNITKIQTGFYPKVINDFNVFYNGYDLYREYTDSEIQSSVDGGVKVFNFPTSNISTTRATTSTIEDLSIQTWSVVLPNGVVDLTNNSAACNTSNNTTSPTYYVVPSFGTQFNQVNSECLVNNISVCPFIDNPSIYNGSVRLLWAASNYGYFNNTQISKPNTDSYINKITTGTIQQSAFKLKMDADYSNIEEIFSVFDKSILDKFEEEFLNFSKPISNIDLGVQIPAPVGVSPTDPNALFKNFQYLFRNLMEIKSNDGSLTNEQYFNTVGQNQLTVFSNTIKSFMEYDVILKYGNPADYNRRVMASYIVHVGGNNAIVSPILFNPYIKNSLPSIANTTSVATSKSNYPAAWSALETEVGFSTITNLTYTDSGSYITDFFIDSNIEFTEDNVVLCAPLIKMYATQKLYSPTLTANVFGENLQTYLNNTTLFQNNILNQILTQVRAKLPDQQQLPERTIQSVIDGQQSKVETYETFKALNDKWVAGSDFTTKTLFEDIMFLDRASRNIGDTIIVDIFSFKNVLSENSLNIEMSVFVFLSGFLIQNKFNVMSLPSYVNFYNVQDVDGTTRGKSEGKLEFADNMWGTFLDVDYRNSSPKMICFYAGAPSAHLADLPKGNSRFRDDAFDLRRASDNPLIEDQTNKKDWALSNKCVGFNVDIGTSNQGVFNSFQVSMDAGKATSESLQADYDLINQYNGRNVTTQNISLYNIYKQRSYKCNVTCLGNALLQPAMYFNLRHVPMFNGPYYITDITHTISPGIFETTFGGIRQSVFDLPSIDSFLQSINQNLLTKVESIVRNRKDSVTAKAITNIDKSKYVSQVADSTAAAQNSCSSNLAEAYQTWGDVQSSVTTTLTQTQFVNELKKKTTDTNLQILIYEICYVKTFRESSKSFYGYNNNYANVTLTTDFGTNSNYFSNKKYSCVNISNSTDKPTSQPVANFDDIGKFFDFMISRLSPNVDRVFDVPTGLGVEKYYVCYWPVSTVSEEYYDSHRNEYTTLDATFERAKKSLGDAGLVTTPTASDVTNVPCLPPSVLTISPLTGVSGTILTITGTHFDEITGITINNVLTTTGITVNSPFNLSVVVPYSNTTVPQKNTVVVRGVNGSGVSLGNFTYNPIQTTPTTPTTIPGLPPNVNTQPQQTGPTVMSATTSYNSNGTLDFIKVIVTPEATTKKWFISLSVPIQIYYTVSRKEAGPNNTIVVRQISSSRISTNTSLYYSSTFNDIVITNFQLQQLLSNNGVVLQTNDDIDYNISVTSENILLTGKYQTAVQPFKAKTKVL